MLLSLSTGHTIGLALVAGAFIVFALLVAMVIPRYRPDFPGRNLGAFIWVALAFFVATLLAVEFFGAESKEAEGAQPETTQTAPATTGSTSTEATTTAAGGNATNGQALYTSAGCAGCHSINGSKGTGPTFKGLAGSKTELTNGQSVTADTAYLTKSIDDPDAEIVKGYSPGIMSAVVKPGSVSESDTADLVAFIEKQK